MTPKEWAVLTVDYLVLDGERCRLNGRHREDWIANIAARVKAAIEEEREACARDADDELARARELQVRRGDYGGDMFRAGITQGRAQSSSLIAARIRARSVSKP